MTATTVAINCDVSLADGSEFTAARLDFTLSGPDFDAATNDVIPPHTVEVALDADGVGVANLWPVDLGVNNTRYKVEAVGSFVQNGLTKSLTFTLGNITPPSTGAPFDLADLLALESGGIVVGSVTYATIADAVAAAVAAAATAETMAIASGAPIFPDTAAGIAGVDDGAVFEVPAPGGGLLIYERNGATADLIGSIKADNFPSRTEALAYIAAGGTFSNGATYRIGGLEFVGATGSTVIADLPGLSPLGDWTAAHFGLDLTGGSSATAALANVPDGSVIDMMGGLIQVSAIPLEWRAFNGAWLVGADKFDMRYDAGSPFVGQVATVGDYPFTFWPGGAWYDESTDLMYMAQIVAHAHAPTHARVDLLTSKDHGATFSRYTIFSDAANPQIRDAVIGKMDGGRIGGIVSTGDTSRKQWFLSNDGAGWTAVEITGLTIDHFVYGDLLRGFSGAANDWMIASYAGTAAAKVLRTIDNGATWAEYTLRDSAGLPGTSPKPEEPIILHAPGIGWACFARVGNTPAAIQNMYVTTSVDGATWSAWQDTGIALGSNPVYGVYDGGKFELILSFRGGPFIGGDQDNIIQSVSILPSELFADASELGRKPRRDIAALPTLGIGYFCGTKIPRKAGDPNGEWVFFGKANESEVSVTLGASADMVRLSRIQIATANRQPAIQLMDNVGFTHKRRGTSFGPLAVNFPFADRWYMNASGATCDVALTPMTEVQRNIFPMFDTVATVTATANDFTGIAQNYLGQDAFDMVRILDQAGKLTARIYGFGTMPPLALQVLVNGSGATATATSFPVPPACADGGWVTEVEFQITNIAVLPSAATSCTISINTGATSNAWPDTDVVGITLWSGEAPPMDGPRMSDPIDNTYLQRWEGNDNRFMIGAAVSTTGAWFFKPDAGMKSTPVVSYSALSDIVVERGLTESALSSIALTTSADWIGGYQLRGVTTGLTVAQSLQLKITNPGGWLQVDTGF